MIMWKLQIKLKLKQKKKVEETEEEYYNPFALPIIDETINTDNKDNNENTQETPISKFRSK